jgi:hypothetical protein
VRLQNTKLQTAMRTVPCALVARFSPSLRQRKLFTPGIDKIVAAAPAINSHIHVIAGGFHLFVASDADIEKIVTAVHDTFKVKYVAPGHCTGEPAFTTLKKAFADRYLYAGLGTRLELLHTSQK